MPSGKAVSAFSPSSRAGEGPDLVTHNPWLFPNQEPRKSWKKNNKNKNHRAGSDFLPEEGRHLVNSTLPVSEWMLFGLPQVRPCGNMQASRDSAGFPASWDGEDAGHLKGTRSVSPGPASSGCGQGHAASATSVPGIWSRARRTRSVASICRITKSSLLPVEVYVSALK